MSDIRFTNNAVQHSNNFIPISRTAWNYFLLLTNSGERGIRSFNFIRFDSLGCHIAISFSFFFFSFYRFVAFNVCKLVRGLFPFKIFPTFKDGASSKILRFLPVIFSSQRSRQKKKRRQGDEEREITEGTTEKWKKEMVGGKIPGKIGELGRGQQLPSAHYFRLSLVHVTYCFRSRAWGRKREKNGQRQSIS